VQTEEIVSYTEAVCPKSQRQRFKWQNENRRCYKESAGIFHCRLSL